MSKHESVEAYEIRVERSRAGRANTKRKARAQAAEYTRWARANPETAARAKAAPWIGEPARVEAST